MALILLIKLKIHEFNIIINIRYEYVLICSIIKNRKLEHDIMLTAFLGKYLPGEKNASHHTIQSYSFTFKLLLTFFESVKTITPELLSMSDLTRDAITDFLDWLESERSCSITTRNQRLVAIRSFVRFVQKQSPENLYEFQRILNIPDKKCARTVVPFLTGDEMRILLSVPDPSTRNGLRDLALLALLYDSAARVQEIIDLKAKDLRLEKPAVITLHGKGQKTRQVPIQYARGLAVKQVNFIRLMTYYSIGRWIVEEQQEGSSRAKYGQHVINNLSKNC